MRIVEQTECVLVLRSSANFFWFETIFLLFGSLLTILFTVPHVIDGWLRVLLVVLMLFAFCLGLQQAWSSDVVKSCSFDRVFNRITISFHGLKPTTKNFSLGEMPVLEVREAMQAIYGSICTSYQLWLVTSSENIFLSDDVTNAASEEIVERVREFLIPLYQ
jgi:hypothetical protein